MVVVADRPRPKAIPALVAAHETHVQASAQVEEQYKNFDVVWGKMARFPWWPAVLFYSWDAVNAAGLELKTAQNQLVIPPPRKQLLADGTGERLVHSVLIMFLDKFNCLVMELSPKTVCPFALNYERLHKPKGSTPSGFKVALQRAERILHMNSHMTEEELDEIAPIRVELPPVEAPVVAAPVRSGSGDNTSSRAKRQKRVPAQHQVVESYEEMEEEFVVDNGEVDEVEEEEEEEEEDNESDYADLIRADSKTPSRGRVRVGRAPTVKPVKKASTKASQQQQQQQHVIDLAGSKSSSKKGHAPAKPRNKRPTALSHVEAIDDGESDDFEMTVVSRTAAEKKEPVGGAASKRKKASRKEGRFHQQQHQHHHDVISVDDDEYDEDDDFVIEVVRPPAKKQAAKAKSPKKGKHEVAPVKKVAATAAATTIQIKKTPLNKKKPTKKKKNKKNKKDDSSDSESDFDQNDFELYEEEEQQLPEIKKNPRKTKAGDTSKHSHSHHNGHHSHHQATTQTTSEANTSSTGPEDDQPMLTPLSTIWTTREPPKEGEAAVSGVAEGEGEARGRLAYQQDLLWNDAIFADWDSRTELDGDGISAEDQAAIAAVAPSNGERTSSKRQVRSVQQSQIRQSLVLGTLDPHTMVQCEAYLPKGGISSSQTTDMVGGGRGSRGATPQLDAPFEVVVHPDVVFVSDLHAHLATCEIIGFLGGRWDDERKTLYIQAAFPCRSLVIEGDDGSTDVEMDPGSEIELREIIQNAELEVVGWYHSHPEFAPDPSVVDINNQSNYQQLFQREKQTADGNVEIAEPFVGLIVGTYDTRRESPVALFRYFHTRAERVNSAMRREVNMPYELVPQKRHFRAVLDGERHQRKIKWFTALAKMLLAKKNGLDAKTIAPRDETVKTLKDQGVAETPKQRKRKGSSDANMNLQADVPVVKKKRGRPPKAAATSNKGALDVARAAPEVIDLRSETSQEMLSQSSDHSAEPKLTADATAATTTSNVEEILKNDSAQDLPHAMAEEDVVADAMQTREQDAEDLSSAMDGEEDEDVPTTEALAKCSLQVANESNVDVDMTVGESSQSQDVDVVDAPIEKMEDVHASDHDEGESTQSRQQDETEEKTPQLETDLSEIVSDSIDSQELTIESTSQQPTSQEEGEGVEIQDDLVSASASSSSSSGGSSFAGDTSYLGYDASQSQQSQPMSQSQSQSDEPMGLPSVPTETTTATFHEEEEDDPYAGIMILTSSDSSFWSPAAPSSSDAMVQVTTNADPAVAPVIAEASGESGATAEQQIDKNDGLVWLKDECIVEDSGTDAMDSSTDVPKPSESVAMATVTTNDQLIQRSPAEDDSGSNSAVSGGGSTPVDPSVVFTSARRRTRKPTLTVRTRPSVSPTFAAGRTNVSPRSPGDEKDGVKDEVSVVAATNDSVSSVNETGARGDSDAKIKVAETETRPLAADEPVAVADPVWDNVEVIPSPVVADDTKIETMTSGDATTLSDENPRARTEEETPGTKEEPSSMEEEVAAPEVCDAKAEEAAAMVVDADGTEVVEPTKGEPTSSAPTSGTQQVPSEQVASADVDSVVKAAPSEMSSSLVSAVVTRESDVKKDYTVAATSDQDVSTTTDSVVVEKEPTTSELSSMDVVVSTPSLPVAAVASPMVSLKAHSVAVLKTMALEMGVPKAKTLRTKKPLIAAIEAHYLLSSSSQLSTTHDETKTEQDGKSHQHSNGHDAAAEATMDRDATSAADAPRIQLDETKTKGEELLTTATMAVPAPATEPAPAAPAATLNETAALTAATPTGAVVVVAPQQPRTLLEQRDFHLHRLRTQYGTGVYGCTEQAITLIDYYREFERRTEIFSWWKPKITKADKLEASLRADAQHVNVAVEQRDAFVTDVMGYLRTSWELSAVTRR